MCLSTLTLLYWVSEKFQNESWCEQLTNGCSKRQIAGMTKTMTSIIRTSLQILSGIFYLSVFALLILAGLTATTKDRTVLITLALVVVVLPVVGYGTHLLIGWLFSSRGKAR